MDHSKILPFMAISQQTGAFELMVQPTPIAAEVDLFGALSVSVLFKGNVVTSVDKDWDANRN